MIGLTARQMQLLRFIRGYQVANGGNSPSCEECARGMGIAYKSGAHRLLTGLEQRGSIRRRANHARAIEIVESPSIPSIDGLPLYAVPLVGVRSVRFSGERL